MDMITMMTIIDEKSRELKETVAALTGIKIEDIQINIEVNVDTDEDEDEED